LGGGEWEEIKKGDIGKRRSWEGEGTFLMRITRLAELIFQAVFNI